MKTTTFRINNKHFLLTKTGTGRRITIGDVHGCAKTLKALVWEKIKPTLDDQIIFLGDYLHRGDDSAGVMDFIFELREKGYEIFTLSGNHEQMALEKDIQAREKYEIMSDEERTTYTETYKNIPRLLKKANFADENRIIFPKYRQFLENLPCCYQMADFVFVHAGINFKTARPFEDFEAMLWQRDDDSVPAWLDFRIIHGHTVTRLSEIETQVRNREKVINIDNGCYYGVNPDNVGVQMGFYGNLCALDVDNWALYTQKCLDLGDDSL